MKRLITMLIGSVVLLANGVASADISEAELVDWEEAIADAELVGTFVDENGVKWNEFWDGEQKVHWAQVASLTDEEALKEALYEQDSLGDSPLRTNYVVPHAVAIWVDSTMYVTYDIDFVTGSGCNNGYYAIYDTSEVLEEAERIYSLAYSQSSDYCDDGYESWYHTGTQWVHDTDDDCFEDSSIWIYRIDATDDLDYVNYQYILLFAYEIPTGPHGDPLECFSQVNIYVDEEK